MLVIKKSSLFFQTRKYTALSVVSLLLFGVYLLSGEIALASGGGGGGGGGGWGGSFFIQPPCGSGGYCASGGGGGGNNNACTPTYSNCNSSPNSCGMTNPGQRNSCTGVCNATSPAESLCTPPIDGGWSYFGPCSATACGTTGTQTRTCTNPAPANGGANCVGSPTQSCATLPCCIPDCNRRGQVCVGKTFNDANGCGINNCEGARSCDYNWKEVAP